MENEDHNADDFAGLQAAAAKRELEGTKTEKLKHKLRRNMKLAKGLAQVMLLAMILDSAVYTSSILVKGNIPMTIAYGVMYAASIGCFFWSRKNLLPPVLIAAVILSVFPMVHEIIRSSQSTGGFRFRLGGGKFVVVMVFAVFVHRSLKRKLRAAKRAPTTSEILELNANETVDGETSPPAKIA